MPWLSSSSICGLVVVLWSLGCSASPGDVHSGTVVEKSVDGRCSSSCRDVCGCPDVVRASDTRSLSASRSWVADVLWVFVRMESWRLNWSISFSISPDLLFTDRPPSARRPIGYEDGVVVYLRFRVRLNASSTRQSSPNLVQREHIARTLLSFPRSHLSFE